MASEPSARTREVLAELRSRDDPVGRAGMARYGIEVSTAVGGWRLPELRAMAKRLGRDHALVEALWASGLHEARLLAAFVEVPAAVTEEQMERWALDFASWDVVDGVCCHLFARTPFAWRKAVEWAARDEEFVKRAAFSLMACLAVHDKHASDEDFEALFPVMERAAGDHRHYVKKAVNWALRQIGKRNRRLHRAALDAADRIHAQGSSSARWIASDALRRLRSEAVEGQLAKADAATARRPRP